MPRGQEADRGGVLVNAPLEVGDLGLERQVLAVREKPGRLAARGDTAADREDRGDNRYRADR